MSVSNIHGIKLDLSWFNIVTSIVSSLEFWLELAGQSDQSKKKQTALLVSLSLFHSSCLEWLLGWSSLQFFTAFHLLYLQELFFSILSFLYWHKNLSELNRWPIPSFLWFYLFPFYHLQKLKTKMSWSFSFCWA